MLKLQFKDQRKPAIWLVDSRYSIGSNVNNDIVLEDAGVSGYHADIQVEDNDRIFITDAGSVAGIRVNGQPVQGRTQLRANDVIAIQSVELQLLDPKEQARQDELAGGATAISPALQGIVGDQEEAGSRAEWILQARTGSLVGESFDIPGHGTLTIGRSRDCDLVLPSNHVSRHHAELYMHGGQPWVRDLDSSNGTYVNRKKVSEQGLNGGDELRFDTLVFEVRGPDRDEDDGGAVGVARTGAEAQAEDSGQAEAGRGDAVAEPARASGDGEASGVGTPGGAAGSPPPAGGARTGHDAMVSEAAPGDARGGGSAGIVVAAVVIVLAMAVAWWLWQG